MGLDALLEGLDGASGGGCGGHGRGSREGLGGWCYGVHDYAMLHGDGTACAKMGAVWCMWEPLWFAVVCRLDCALMK